MKYAKKPAISHINYINLILFISNMICFGIIKYNITIVICIVIIFKAKPTQNGHHVKTMTLYWQHFTIYTQMDVHVYMW